MSVFDTAFANGASWGDIMDESSGNPDAQLAPSKPALAKELQLLDESSRDGINLMLKSAMSSFTAAPEGDARVEGSKPKRAWSQAAWGTATAAGKKRDLSEMQTGTASAGAASPAAASADGRSAIATPSPTAPSASAAAQAGEPSGRPVALARRRIGARGAGKRAGMSAPMESLPEATMEDDEDGTSRLPEGGAAATLGATASAPAATIAPVPAALRRADVSFAALLGGARKAAPAAQPAASAASGESAGASSEPLPTGRDKKRRTAEATAAVPVEREAAASSGASVAAAPDAAAAATSAAATAAATAFTKVTTADGRTGYVINSSAATPAPWAGARKAVAAPFAPAAAEPAAAAAAPASLARASSAPASFDFASFAQRVVQAGSAGGATAASASASAVAGAVPAEAVEAAVQAAAAAAAAPAAGAATSFKGWSKFAGRIAPTASSSSAAGAAAPVSPAVSSAGKGRAARAGSEDGSSSQAASPVAGVPSSAMSVATGTVGASGRQAPEELTEERLRARGKQVDIGKATPEYAAYVAAVPKDSRKKREHTHPTTPDRTAPMSKRQWMGLVRDWRRRLHAWADANGVAAAPFSADLCVTETGTTLPGGDGEAQ